MLLRATTYTKFKMNKIDSHWQALPNVGLSSNLRTVCAPCLALGNCTLYIATPCLVKLWALSAFSLKCIAARRVLKGEKSSTCNSNTKLNSKIMYKSANIPMSRLCPHVLWHALDCVPTVRLEGLNEAWQEASTCESRTKKIKFTNYREACEKSLDTITVNPRLSRGICSKNNPR